MIGEQKLVRTTMASEKGAWQNPHLTLQQFLLGFTLIAATFSLYFFGPPTVPNVSPKPIILSAVLQIQDARSVQVEKISERTKAVTVTGKSA